MVEKDVWAQAIGAWVTLANLGQVAQREFNLSSEDTAAALRNPLETGRILTHVEGFPHSEYHRGYNAAKRRWISCGNALSRRNTNRVSDLGWKNVDWKNGTLDGYPVNVYWKDVKFYLEDAAKRAMRLAATPSPQANTSKRAGGRPAAHDWDKFWIEVAIWTEGNGFKHGARSDLQKHMEEWTATQWHVAPDPATIREKVRALFEEAASKGVCAAPN